MIYKTMNTFINDFIKGVSPKFQVCLLVFFYLCFDFHSLLVVFRPHLVLGVHHTGEGEAVAGRTENE